MKTKRWMSVILCLSVLAMGVMNLSGCGAKVQAANLMEGIAAKPVCDQALSTNARRPQKQPYISAVGHVGALHDGKRSEGGDSCANGSSARRRYSHGNAERISVFLYKGTAL